jgi:4-amino-4-deoxy-L-arabinose transferase-like glycosyltransferase
MLNPDKKRLWILFVIIILGFLLRIYRLDHQSVWFDEALTMIDSQLPLKEITDRITQDFAHPPLHHYALHFWFKLFGFSSFQARFLSAVFDTLSIVMIYLLAKYLFERRTALLAASLLAVSQLAVMYAQEARPYTLLLFLVLCAMYLFVIAIREHRALSWWGFVGLAALIIYTHYHGMFIVASMLLYAILYRRRFVLPEFWLVGAGVFIPALLAPWITISLLKQVLVWKSTLFIEQPSYFAVHWGTFLSTINKYNNGHLVGIFSDSPWWAFLIGGLLFTVPAIFALAPVLTQSRGELANRVQQENIILLGILWILPLTLGIGISAAIQLRYDVRYLLFCIAPYYILVARGISELRFSLLRRVLVVLVLAYSVFSLRANYFIPYKENYRDALAYLAHQYTEGDNCIFLPFGTVPLEWSVYYGRHPGLRLINLDAVTSNPQTFKRVWLITYRRIIWAVRKGEEGKRKLEATHLLMEEKQYHGVHVSLYVPKQQ